MARMRTMKPETFTSETLANVSVHARWTFGGLWCYCDDEGRGRANAGLIKAAVWPLDEDIATKHVEHFLDELEDERLICRYEVDGKAYLHVVNFGEHQHPNRPVESKLPACSRRTHGGLSERAVSPHPEGSGGANTGGRENAEVSGMPETGQTARTSDKPAGQMALTEDAVRTHGGLKRKSFSIPPTPVVTTGVGEGEGIGEQQASPAAANGSRHDAPLTITQRSKRITDAFVAARPLSKWPAINGIVIRAIKTECYADDEIQAALLRLVEENTPVTIETLRVELEGLPPRTTSAIGRRDQAEQEQFARQMARAADRENS